MFSSALVSKLVSDVNKDWTCKDKDKDQAYNDQEREKRENFIRNCTAGIPEGL